MSAKRGRNELVNVRIAGYIALVENEITFTAIHVEKQTYETAR